MTSPHCDFAAATFAPLRMALMPMRFCHGGLRLCCCHLASVIAPTAAAATVLNDIASAAAPRCDRLYASQCHSATAVPANAVQQLHFHDGASATALPRLRLCHCASATAPRRQRRQGLQRATTTASLRPRFRAWTSTTTPPLRLYYGQVSAPAANKCAQCYLTRMSFCECA